MHGRGSYGHIVGESELRAMEADKGNKQEKQGGEKMV